LPNPRRAIPFHSSPPGERNRIEKFCYWLQARGEINRTPKAPREPTSEMALALGGEQTSTCVRGTLSDEAGALPTSIVIATVANILVVRIGGSGAKKSELSARTYAQNSEQVVTTYTAARAKALLRLCF